MPRNGIYKSEVLMCKALKILYLVGYFYRAALGLKSEIDANSKVMKLKQYRSKTGV
ncbi:MAG: hypothetical protein QNJ54_25415 [Prochloraceae cyanobacterium]|nr:hypothetical protein [Prochloraceae cyanobacterium]